MTAPSRPRLYLAGPEVFLPDAIAVGAEKKRLAAEAGFEGLFPLDNALSLEGVAKLEQARRISLANEALIRSADGLIANLTPFRGVSADAGTAFEVGFARALGRPVLAYSNAGDLYLTRASAYRRAAPGLADADRAGVAIEDFDLAENLMLDIAVRESGSAVVCRTVLPGAEMRDLAGYRACLADARRIFGLA
jgi:nucleoside 2-deoxyribosyltransferase